MLRALTEIDALIGEILALLRGQRTVNGATVLDETTIMLFGDHGMVPSGRFLDLVSFFRPRGLSAYDASTLTHVVLRERLGQVWTQWPDVVLVSGGSNITQVYLRSATGGWTDDQLRDRAKVGTSTTDVARLAVELAELEGVGQVLRLVSPGEVEILARNGRRARILDRTLAGERRFAYVVPDAASSDPLQYLADALVAPLVCRTSRLDDSCFRSSDEWMKSTLHARYPAAVPLVPKAFHPQRFTGDLMVTALPGWSFIRSQAGDHGNLEREAILTPWLINGPGVEGATPPSIPRLVDLYPTAAVLLGADPNDPVLRALDGRPIPGVRGPELADPDRPRAPVSH